MWPIHEQWHGSLIRTNRNVSNLLLFIVSREQRSESTLDVAVQLTLWAVISCDGGWVCAVFISGNHCEYWIHEHRVVVHGILHTHMWHSTTWSCEHYRVPFITPGRPLVMNNEYFVALSSSRFVRSTHHYTILPPPPACLYFITCSSWQIGSIPVCSISARPHFRRLLLTC